MASYFITGGRVIDPASKTDAKFSVLIEEGKVSQLTQSRKAPEGAVAIDASGCIVSPGFIDMHVHLRDPGQEYKEDIESGTRAAAAGGFTTICCMPNTEPSIDCASVAQYVIDRAREKGACNVLPIGAITRGLAGEAMSDIGDLAGAGACAISDDGKPVMNAGVMRRAMEYAKAFGLPVIAHSEDRNLAGVGVMNEGLVSTELGLKGIPAVAEEAMIARDIMLAELTGSHLHVAHASTMGSVELISHAKRRGISVTAEATPHHLTLTDEAVSDFDPNTKVNPPLRTEADRTALIKALADGTIDAIATDHAPHNIVDKEMGFESAAFGISGLETMLPLMLALVNEKKITLKRMIEALTSAPAKILNLKGKGTLKAGSDADVTIFDPAASWTVQADRFISRGHNTPFDGLRVTGKVKWTIVGGRIAYSS